MEPKYMNENRYSYLAGFWKQPATLDYEAENPETAFEFRVQSLFIEGQTHLQHEEFVLALQSFRELMALILHTANPQMPVDPNQFMGLMFPMDASLIDTLSSKAAEILLKTPLPDYNFPPSLISDNSILSNPVMEVLKPALQQGLKITSYHSVIKEQLKPVAAAIEEGNYQLALEHYNVALNSTPDSDIVMKASLLHDIAIISEKNGDRLHAEEFAQQSVRLFHSAKLIEAQVQALDSFTGILNRSGKERLAAEQAKIAAELRTKNNINPILPEPTAIPSTRLLNILPAAAAKTRSRRLPVTELTETLPKTTSQTFSESKVDAPTLMALKYIKSGVETKSMVIRGENTAVTINLDTNAGNNIKQFLNTISVTEDLRVISDFWYNKTQMIAYLPHMYFFIIPMAIGDCLTGIGNLKQAEEQYKEILAYPYINKKYEVVKLWTRLAQVYLDMGDNAYRIARDNVNSYGIARNAYENIVLIDKTLKNTSPLYQDASFSSIKTRVINFLAAPDPAEYDDNPAIIRLVLEALSKLEQIQAELNFFGFGKNYTPPFSFEYLQNTARYFAQQASHIEQRYIQFKSQAESEEFRREQLDQQAEVAEQTIILEQRGVAEANAGISVANASVNYAEVQRQNAIEAQNDFAAVRWELLELTELEAWANAASVDQDDEVSITISNYGYYNTEDRRRSLVIQDLSHRRTRISHDLEAAKLQRAIDSAAAYKQIAEAQLNQAQIRKAVAEQRVKIAQLQQKQAVENRDFLDMREFSAHLWYELAIQIRHLKQRYLDMANEIAFLMERAYNAETERNLYVIRYNYANTSANNLLGADLLLADIDYFTYDHVTTTKTKKIPVKKIISLADSHPMAFQQLKTTGRCYMQTEFADFDRQHPGLYLCKLQNVELVFIGLANVTSIAGTLRNIGVSRFRLENGNIVSRLYPADVMALSQYEIRQDTLAFRFNPNDLRLFENNGIDTLWELDLPLGANDFDYQNILDIQLVLYYDGFFNAALETAVSASLPLQDTASRAFSLRMSYFDEFYYLKNKGEGEIIFDAQLFPYNQKNLIRTLVTMKAQGKPETVNNLTLRLISANHGSEFCFATDAEGEVNLTTPGQPLSVLNNEAMLDKWTIRITAEDNPALVNNGVPDLSGLNDIMFFFEYTFEYR